MLVCEKARSPTPPNNTNPTIVMKEKTQALNFSLPLSAANLCHKNSETLSTYRNQPHYLSLMGQLRLLSVCRHARRKSETQDCVIDDQERISALRCFRRHPTSPTNPAPTSRSVPGSGAEAVGLETTANCKVPNASTNRTDQSKPEASVGNDRLRKPPLMVQPVQVSTPKVFPKDGENPFSSATLRLPPNVTAAPVPCTASRP